MKMLLLIRIKLVPDPGLKNPVWMELAAFATINENDIDVECVERVQPWHECEQPAVTSLHRLNASTYIKNYILSKEFQKPIEKIDANLLTSDQKLAYDIVLRHFESTTTKALRLIIHGTAGTGKTFILKALKSKLTDAIFLTASIYELIQLNTNIWIYYYVCAMALLLSLITSFSLNVLYRMYLKL